MLRFPVASSVYSLSSLSVPLKLDFSLQPFFKVACHRPKLFLAMLEQNSHKVSSFLT
jgi:hypothetical protein